MELKTGKLNQRVLLAAVLLFLAAAAVAAVLVIPGSGALPETAYTEVDAAIGTVRFVNRTTSAEEYQTLLAACDACRETVEQSGIGGVNSAVVVSEETFVDSGAAEEASQDPAVYVESETVYFEGLVLVRYVSQWGDHLAFAAGYDTDGYPVVLSMDGLAMEGLDEPALRLKAEDGVMDEKTFLDSVNECVNALLSGGEEPAALEMLFTESGAAALRRVGQSAGEGESRSSEILLCGIGSTSSDEMLADRIYLRCRVTVEEKSVVLDILLKLNDELMIFDEDLI